MATTKTRTRLAPVDACNKTQKVSKRAAERAHKHAWAHAGVGMCVFTSACLNGYANAMHASIPVAGAMLGVMIPCLVLVLSKVAGMQWKGRVHTLAYFTAGTGVSLLILSIYHCACSIALLTGSHMLLCIPMAIAIDCGLVCCELDVILG